MFATLYVGMPIFKIVLRFVLALGAEALWLSLPRPIVSHILPPSRKGMHDAGIMAQVAVIAVSPYDGETDGLLIVTDFTMVGFDSTGSPGLISLAARSPRTPKPS